MSFPLFLRGMLFALAAFAITTYFLTQSIWLTVLWTVLCAVIIQVGYFVGVLLMVWGQAGKSGNGQTPPEARNSGVSPEENQPARNSEHVSG